MPETTVPAPDVVLSQPEIGGGWQDAASVAVTVTTTAAGEGLRVDVEAAAVAGVVLRWRRPLPAEALVLGDAWERAYGDLEWRAMRAERFLPWTALVHDPSTGNTIGFGVEVRGAAFAVWTVDRSGVSLWLDLRSGGDVVRPGGRVLAAATVRAVRGEPSAFATQRALAALQCRDAMPLQPIVGANNWYYAYGRGFDQHAVVRDARTIAQLAGDHPIRPFGVIDDGWSVDGTADGLEASAGPWDRGRSPEFGEMADAAAAIRAEGVRPGLWFRPLLTRVAAQDGMLRPRDGAFGLDASSTAVRELVAADVARFVDWGFDLVKHDFSTYDLLGRWGPAMRPFPSGGGPALSDPTVTTAEALVGLYGALREAAGDAVLIGCNVVGHLAAGLVDVQRVGDDTSGVEWGRTRRVGVNALAFRLAQHGTFFGVDADCVPSTAATPWAQNRQFLDLVARSGTALFVSVDPATRTDAVDADLAAAVTLALDGGDAGGVEPLDWLTSSTPEHWRAGEGRVDYDWIGTSPADPFEAERSADPASVVRVDWSAP